MGLSKEVNNGIMILLELEFIFFPWNCGIVEEYFGLEYRQHLYQEHFIL